MVRVDSLEVAYRSAFEDFSSKAQQVQSLTENPTGDRKAFETALLELEKAHLAYNSARDAFVRSLLPQHDNPRKRSVQDISGDVPALPNSYGKALAVPPARLRKTGSAPKPLSSGQWPRRPA